MATFASVGKRICKYRQMRGKSQEWLAQEIELSARTVGSIERGSDCKLSVLVDIAAALDVTVCELLASDKLLVLTGQQQQALREHVTAIAELLTPPN